MLILFSLKSVEPDSFKSRLLVDYIELSTHPLQNVNSESLISSWSRTSKTCGMLVGEIIFQTVKFYQWHNNQQSVVCTIFSTCRITWTRKKVRRL